MKFYLNLLLFGILIFLGACSNPKTPIDVLIVGGTIVDGSGEDSFIGDLAINGDKIIFIGNNGQKEFSAQKIIDATGHIVSPGFIDPHTHSIDDLESSENNSNINYLMQGVSTVINGNDGDGAFDINSIEKELTQNGIGTNAGFLVGHGMVRQEVLGMKDVSPNEEELEAMKALVRQGMETGALGFSSGLYYAPGSYAKTEELIALAKETAPFGGFYDTHIRDESTYNIGLIDAVKEAIQIGSEAGIPVHFAHIKALGVDVWGKSDEIISIIEEAQKNGTKITADQYPWLASGTNLQNALIDRWVMAGGDDAYYKKLNDPAQIAKIKAGIKENLRKRGGPEALLITADAKDTSLIGYTLAELSKRFKQDPVEVALKIAKDGGARVASFNMDSTDLENFMVQPWVMTCSDGTKGHPRKFASYSQKYQVYVVEKKLLSIESFVHKSSGQVANTFGIEERGLLKEGFFADIIIFDKDGFKPSADFYHPAELSKGIQYMWVNGSITIEKSEYNDALAGRVLKKNQNN